MKNKIYMAAVATALCTALIIPAFTMPVFACEDGKEIIWEEETPFVAALWGKYSPDGKLVYRVSNVGIFDFYAENVDEILGYGFEITDERVNERGETYYKFEYISTQEVLLTPQTGDTEIIENTETYEPIPDIPEPDKPTNTETYEPPVEPEEPKTENTETEEPVFVTETPSDYETITIYETEYPTFITEGNPYEEWIPAETVEVVEITEIVETPVEIVEVTEIVETPVEIVEVTEVIETSSETNEEINPFSEDGKEIIWEDEDEDEKDNEQGNEGNTGNEGEDEYNKEVVWEKDEESDKETEGLLDCGCKPGHCADGKEIIWEI